MNVLDGSKRLLPQLEFDRGVELSEAGVKEALESIRIR